MPFSSYASSTLKQNVNCYVICFYCIIFNVTCADCDLLAKFWQSSVTISTNLGSLHAATPLPNHMSSCVTTKVTPKYFPNTTFVSMNKDHLQADTTTKISFSKENTTIEKIFTALLIQLFQGLKWFPF